MFDYELEQVKKKLDRLVRAGRLQGKNIYLFGVSDNTRKIIQVLRSYKLEPVYILDNDTAKQHGYCSHILVISIEEVNNLQNEKNLYIGYSQYWREMLNQLQEKKVKKENILMLYKGETLWQNLGYAWRGKKVYEKLIKKYGNIPIFLCPYTGTGDIYLIGTFWKQYLKQEKINNYVFLVINKACEKTAMLFDIKNTEVLEQKIESTYLIQYHMLCPEKAKIKILNDSWLKIHVDPLKWFRGFKGLNFKELFRKFVFELPDTARPEAPVLKETEELIEESFHKNDLQVGNTVVLSPYSNTLADLPDVFWNKLVEELKKEGFSVCTNGNGDTEPALKGTSCVFVPLHRAPQWIEKAGYFIGVRSGFCDIISASKAKKIILYDARERFFNCSAYEYFNLKDMELCDDAVELLFDRDDRNLSEKIMNCITKWKERAQIECNVCSG